MRAARLPPNWRSGPFHHGSGDPMATHPRPWWLARGLAVRRIGWAADDSINRIAPPMLEIAAYKPPDLQSAPGWRSAFCPASLLNQGWSNQRRSHERCERSDDHCRQRPRRRPRERRDRDPDQRAACHCAGHSGAGTDDDLAQCDVAVGHAMPAWRLSLSCRAHPRTRAGVRAGCGWLRSGFLPAGSDPTRTG